MDRPDLLQSAHSFSFSFSPARLRPAMPAAMLGGIILPLLLLRRAGEGGEAGDDDDGGDEGDSDLGGVLVMLRLYRQKAALQ
jgi:hypothetical protein